MNVTEILSELDDHGFEDVTTPRKVAMINDVLWEICSREPWPFLEASATATINTTTGQITAPTDISKILALVNTTDGYSLVPERLDVLTKLHSPDLTKQDKARHYYSLGESFYVYPIPQDGSYLIRYLKIPTELTDASAETAIVLPPRHHRAIVLGALVRLYSMEDDPELASLFADQYEHRLAMMREDLWKKQYDRPERIYDTAMDDEWFHV